MLTSARYLRYVLGFAIVSLAVGCGSRSSPVAPSGSSASQTFVSGAGSAGGTTIRGSVAGSARLQANRGMRLNSSSSLQVCVATTTNCDDVDDSGNFELTGNFSGDVQLVFTGLTEVVNLTIPNVQPGETVIVTVELNGRSSTVKIESRTDAEDDDSEDDSEDDESEDDESEDDESEDDDSEDEDTEDVDAEDDDVEDDESEDEDN